MNLSTDISITVAWRNRYMDVVAYGILVNYLQIVFLLTENCVFEILYRKLLFWGFFRGVRFRVFWKVIGWMFICFDRVIWAWCRQGWVRYRVHVWWNDSWEIVGYVLLIWILYFRSNHRCDCCSVKWRWWLVLLSVTRRHGRWG